MSGDNVNNANQISGAITYPVSTSSGNEASPSQPRQPQSLQGLLRFAMEATKAEDAPAQPILAPLDDEKKKFLESALTCMTVDVIEILLAAIQKLRTSAELSVESDITEYTNAFESILEYVDRIDTAIDFHKIGGYDIFASCLNAVHAPIRAEACNLLAELCQNNPYCQERALENGFIKSLLDLLDNDQNDHVCVKALYAVSCIIREYPAGLDEFEKHNGLSVLMRTLNKPVDKLRTKTCFLLSALCGTNPTLKVQLINLGFLQLFMSLLTEERRESHEHVLSALANMVKGNCLAIQECQKNEYGLQSILQNHLKTIENIDEAMEEKEYCEDILKSVFTCKTTSVER